MHAGLDLTRIGAALSSTPTVAYSAPHDYPHAASMFTRSPGAERERVTAPAMRLYAHIPFCNYACSFCCYAKHVGAGEAEMRRYVEALKRELEWVPAGTPLVRRGQDVVAALRGPGTPIRGPSRSRGAPGFARFPLNHAVCLLGRANVRAADPLHEVTQVD